MNAFTLSLLHYIFPDGDDPSSVLDDQRELPAPPNNGPLSVVDGKLDVQEELSETREELSDKDLSDSASTDNTLEDSSEFSRPMVMGSGTAGGEEAAQSRPFTYRDEDVTAESWRAHRKHVFILSEAGKPIYSRYGNEEALSSTMGVMMALVSFIQSGDNSIRSIYSGMAQSGKIGVSRCGCTHVEAVSR